MQIPSTRPLPAARSDRAECVPCPPLGDMLLWTALLFLGPVLGTPGLPKAVVDLEPPWILVLREDNVTLKCQGAHTAGDHSIRWFHNGSSIPTQVRPNYSFKATEKDRGEYACQTDQTSLSDPVYLDVFSDWLVLQTPSLVFQKGEPIVLRCHSWRNKPLYKITFFQNGKSKQFSPMNSTFSIPRANLSHSGEYHCTGLIGRSLQASQPVAITVQGSSWSDSSVTVMIAVAVAGIAAVAILAAVVAWFRHRQKQTSGYPEHREMGETLPEEPANLTDAEDAAKVEAENAITYSLLLHPEAIEEEAEEPDYQNHI
ncbi:low affinity immunoglobulin gamma Fc region receptor II-b isoform X3 [Panthera pardus]|uniref:low affinity immunoglobulin gamma Fc region receptor II-b isoform X3 n=1 Tax=Panthera pardus TaxID=9691 RepID=UPI000904D6C3|nr:low affinity immunoglobulin gamma Fc region receptor II-b isoform X3 [Panthera pardus]XP_042781445.1 low affinity immunoglobulin gamma Fc region receptor II-like isoform X1 [Panthera leo]XP_042832253.1 low affinity immunoglobulin gamma Fc region receptor II-b isoform X1 [Panthera tigris]